MVCRSGDDADDECLLLQKQQQRTITMMKTTTRRITGTAIAGLTVTPVPAAVGVRVVWVPVSATDGKH